MSRKIKMFLYGEPGVGKSTFASKMPNPFFITTDGNFEWLDLPEKDHQQVFSWQEAKQVFNNNFDGYDTIVVDLIEDLYKYCEQEYCKKNSLEYVGDENYGKGWRITEDEFVLEIAKLIGKDKNIILLSHEQVYTVKDRRGIEHTKYTASGRLRDKIIDQIEGRVRYFVRAYMRNEDENGKLVKKRYLSLIPKENEFGIVRGIDEYSVPHDIELDWNVFVDVIGLTEQKTISKEKDVKNEKPTFLEKKKKEKEQKHIEETKEVNVDQEKDHTIEEVKPEKTEVKVEKLISIPDEEPVVIVNSDPKVEIKVEETKETEQPKTMTREEKLAMLRAKLAQN